MHDDVNTSFLYFYNYIEILALEIDVGITDRKNEPVAKRGWHGWLRRTGFIIKLLKRLFFVAEAVQKQLKLETNPRWRSTNAINTFNI